MNQNYNIYKITSSNSELCYIGITKKDINKRLKEHINHFERYKNNNKNFITSFNILIKEGNINIHLLESFIPKDKQHKKDREAYYILYNPTVNKRIENRTHKQWIKEHWDRVKEHKLKYYYNNKEKFKIYKLKIQNQKLEILN